jgi:hypothetical protein
MPKDQSYYINVEIHTTFRYGCSIEEESELVKRIEEGVSRELYKITQDGGIENTNIPPLSFTVPRVKLIIK